MGFKRVGGDLKAPPSLMCGKARNYAYLKGGK